MPFPMRSGRVARGCRSLTITHHPTETAKELGPEHILSSIKFSKCELQSHMCHIPIRRAGSTDTPPTRHSKTSPQSNNPSSCEVKDESTTMKVWKLIRPGVSGKEGVIQLASKTLMKTSTDSLHYKGNPIIETAPETDETQQQAKESASMPLLQPVKMCETVTLCGEA